MRGNTPRLGTPSGTADQVAVRRHNLSLVLTHLRQSGPRSRARVADETGLNKATVSSLVTELTERGLVVQGATERGAVGRPGQTIELDGANHVALGAEINIDYVSALAMNLRGDVVAERRVALDTAHLDHGAAIDQLSQVISGMIEPLKRQGARPVGLTVAVPGLVEAETGVVYEAPNLRWSQTPILDEFKRALGEHHLPIRLDNEANLAALAEMQMRNEGTKDLLLLTGAVGVGGGLVSGGRLLRGGQGFAGEVGHMRLDPAGDLCGCGRRGCWETLVGLNALLSRAADDDDPVRDPSLDVQQRVEEVAGRAAAGDARTIEAIEETCRWLAQGAGILVNILNPEVVVLGGYFATLGPWLAGPLATELPEQVFAPNSGGCLVEFSTLGFSAAVRGGALRALSTVFEDPTVVDVLPGTPTLQAGAIS